MTNMRQNREVGEGKAKSIKKKEVDEGKAKSIKKRPEERVNTRMGGRGEG